MVMASWHLLQGHTKHNTPSASYLEDPRLKVCAVELVHIRPAGDAAKQATSRRAVGGA